MLEQVAHADTDKYQQNGDLDEDNGAVEVGRLLDTDHQHQSAKRNRQKTQQIEYAVCVLQHGWIDPENLQLGSNASKALPVVVVVNEFVPVSARDGRRQLDAKVA